jgi:hypothetical protein
MANLLDRKALKAVFDAATEIRRADQRPVNRTVAVYLAREERDASPKPPRFVTKAHNAMHAAAVDAFGGSVMLERPDGLVAIFPEAGAAIRAGLHALHAMDLSSDVMVLRGSHVAVAVGAAEIVERPFRDLAGPALERATKIISRAPFGQVVVEQETLEGLKPPMRYADIEILAPKKGRIPGVSGQVATVTLKPLGLPQKLEDDMEAVDAELRSRGRR